jgi:hypothetical protein
MSTRLRHIALTVEKNQAGGFHWLLIESAGRKLFVLERAQRAFSTYLRALQAGFEHLALLSASGLHERGIEHNPDQAEQYPRQVELVE